MSAFGRAVVEGFGGAMAGAEQMISEERLLKYKADLEERQVRLKASLDEQSKVLDRKTQIDVANINATGRGTESRSVSESERDTLLHEFGSKLLDGIGSSVSDALIGSNKDVETSITVYLERAAREGDEKAKAALKEWRAGIKNIKAAKDPRTLGAVEQGLLGSLMDSGFNDVIGANPLDEQGAQAPPPGGGLLGIEGPPAPPAPMTPTPSPLGPPAPGPGAIQSGLREAGPQGQEKPPLSAFVRG
jgi:hypothetical protein